LEEAAVGGHPGARDAFATHELKRGKYDRAMKHVLIGATLGHDGSINSLRQEST
jgi:hypothetical protein